MSDGVKGSPAAEGCEGLSVNGSTTETVSPETPKASRAYFGELTRTVVKPRPAEKRNTSDGFNTSAVPPGRRAVTRNASELWAV